MSDLTYQPVGLYPRDRERIAAIRSAHPGLTSLSEAVRYAIEIAADAAAAEAAQTEKPKRAAKARAT